jgi:hypothetical protein
MDKKMPPAATKQIRRQKWRNEMDSKENPERKSIRRLPLRAIIEFSDDLNRMPIVYPLGDTDREDEALRQAITERWAAR